MSDKTVKEQLKELEDKVENKLGIDLPSIAWIFIAVISADILFNVLTSVIGGLF